ncbi:MAG: hypothetical protein KBG28_21175 [Kofleriaceae bacterium]|jgi:hypothetical protein|nr:hypothetical protein [Kofleriaceae bacterium]
MQKFVAITLFAVAAAGCAAPSDADTRVVILNNVPPSEGCGVEASEDSHISSGVLDVRSERGYLLTPVLKNFSSSEGGTLEDQRLFFAEGADISLRFLRLTQFDTAFSVIINASVSPDGGLSATRFELMSPALMSDLRAAIDPGSINDDTMIATVQVYGEQGGSELITRPFDYPVRLCNGCADLNLGPCLGLPEGFMGASRGGECSPYQDAYVQCCTTSTGFYQCPAEPEDPPAAR